MERATIDFQLAAPAYAGAQVPIHIFVVLAIMGRWLTLGRLLIENGYNATLYVANFTDKRSPCFFDQLQSGEGYNKKWPILMTSKMIFPISMQMILL